MKTILSNIFLGIILLASLSVNAQKKIFIKHYFGETVITGTPKRIVVIDNGALEAFDMLGIPVTAVASDVPAHLYKYRSDKYLKVGTAWKPDIEAVKKVKPDLIVLGGWNQKTYDQLRAIAPVMGYGENYGDYMASFVSNLKNIAQLFDKQEQADRLLIDYYDEIYKIRELTSNDTKKALILLYTQGQYAAYGAKSRFGFIHDELGVKTSNDTLSTGIQGTLATDELIIRTNPDYIFLVDRDKAFKGEQPDKDQLVNDAIKQTNAFKNGKIILLSGTWYLSGSAPKTLETKISEVRQGLYNQ